MSKNYILDACALIALVKEEDGADLISGLYEDAQTGDTEITINIVNLLEVYYGFRRERGADYADAILHNIEESIIKIAPVSKEVLREAGRIKAEHSRISLADAVVLAEACVSGGILLTADHHEMDKIEQSEPGIRFRWIR
jgi:predicted nucleic acid-binding protein